jgi:hypothetical protein
MSKKKKEDEEATTDQDTDQSMSRDDIWKQISQRQQDFRDEHAMARTAPLSETDDMDGEVEVKTEQDTSEESEEEQKAASDSKDDTESEQSEEADDGPLDVDERLIRLEEDREIQSLKVERQEEQIKKWMSKAHKAEAQLNKTRAGQTAKADESDADDLLSEILEEESPADKKRGREPDWLQDERVERCQMAQNEALLEFYNQYPEMVVEDPKTGQKAEDPGVVEYVRQHGPEFQGELQSGNPTRIRKALNTLLREARLDVLEGRKTSEIEEARKKRALARQATRQRKKTTMSSTSTAPASSTQTSSADELPKDPKKRRDALAKKIEQSRRANSRYAPFNLTR